MEDKSGGILKNSAEDTEIESKVIYICLKNLKCLVIIMTFYFIVYIFVGNIKEKDANEIRSTPVVESGVGSM